MDRTCTILDIVALSCENSQKLMVMVIYYNNGGMELTVDYTGSDLEHSAQNADIFLGDVYQSPSIHLTI